MENFDCFDYNNFIGVRFFYSINSLITECDGDRLAVVAFDSEAYQIFHPSENKLMTLDEGLKESAKQLIRDNIFAGGGTSIEAGLQQGLTDILSTPEVMNDPSQFM